MGLRKIISAAVNHVALGRGKSNQEAADTGTNLTTAIDKANSRSLHYATPPQQRSCRGSRYAPGGTCCSSFSLLDLFRQCRDHVEEVPHDAIIGNFKNGRFIVLIDGH